MIVTTKMTGRFVTAHHPETVEAIQFGGGLRDAEHIASWVRSHGGEALSAHVDCGNYDALYVVVRGEHYETQRRVPTCAWVVRHEGVSSTFEVLHDQEFRYAYSAATPSLLPGMFVAPNGGEVPTIWAENPEHPTSPVALLWRTPDNAPLLDAVARLLPSRDVEDFVDTPARSTGPVFAVRIENPLDLGRPIGHGELCAIVSDGLRASGCSYDRLTVTCEKG